MTELSPANTSPGVLAAAETAKANLRAAASMPEAEAIAYERDLQTICFATEDAAEGRRAFAEKRAPVFRRR